MKVKISYEKYFDGQYRPFFTIGVQTFYLSPVDTKNDARVYVRNLKHAFETLGASIILDFARGQIQESLTEVDRREARKLQRKLKDATVKANAKGRTNTNSSARKLKTVASEKTKR